MKKRIISAALALVMLALSCPLLLVSSLAAEEETYAPFTEADYNALYVTRGAQILLDFYRMNEYWNDPDSESYVDYESMIPEPPAVDAEKAVVDAYYTNHVTAFLMQFAHLTFKKNSVYANHATGVNTPAFTVENGYIKMRKDLGVENYIVLDIPSAQSVATTQYVMKTGAHTSAQFMILQNIRIEATQGGGSVTFNSMLDGFGKLLDTEAIKTEGVAPSYPVSEKTATLTFSVEGRENKKGGAGKVSFLYDRTPLLSKEVTWVADSQQVSGIGYRNSTDMSLYAIRAYNRTLSEQELVQNHFADLAKWFRLDIAPYLTLTEENRRVLEAELLSFDLSSDRAEVVAAYEAEIDVFVYDVLLEDVEEDDAAAYATAEEFVAIAKRYALDVSRIKMLPAENRRQIYAAVVASGSNTAAMLQGAIDAQVEAVLNTYYGRYIDDTVYDYRELYVRQDQLIVAADFFDAKATDAPIYVGVSYDDWVDLYNDYQKNWKSYGFASSSAAILAARDGSEDPTLPGRTATERENNWQSMVDTYVWQGDASHIQPLDIANQSYPHTNIRYFGDGTFICDLNNTVKLIPKNDSCDLTYQIVAKFSGSPNYQLRGFRFNLKPRATTVELQSMNYYAFGLDSKGAPNTRALCTISFAEDPNAQAKVYPTAAGTYSTDVTVTVDKTILPNEHYYNYELDESTGEYVVTEVPTAAESMSGVVTYAGRMDMRFYGNGTLLGAANDLPYQADSQDALGNMGGHEYYALRAYSCVLTNAEIAQNHFADLAGCYDLDLSVYYRLTPSERVRIHEALSAIQLGTPAEEVVEYYEYLLRNAYYDIGSNSAHEEAFVAMISEYGIKIERLLAVSPTIRTSVIDEIMTAEDVLKATEWFACVLQARLEKTIERHVSENYPVSISHRLLTFEGYQLALYGEKPGLRALYTVGEDVLEFLATEYTANITMGLLILPGEDKDARVRVEEGQLVLPENAIASLTVCEGGVLNENVFDCNGKAAFTYEYCPDEADYETEVAYIAYAVVMAEGEEPIIEHATCGEAIGNGAISLLSLSQYAKDTLGMAHPNVQKITGSADLEAGADASFHAGGLCLSDYAVVRTSANQLAVAAYKAMVEKYLGVTPQIVEESELSGVTNVLRIGEADIVYEDPDCYGINVRGGNVYLWYRDAANADALLAYFETFLALAAEQGDYHLPTGTDLVRKAR